MIINKKIFIIFSMIAFLVLLTSTSFSASISMSSSKTTVNPGETFTVSVSGNDATGKVNVSGGNISPSSQWIENNTVTFSVTAPQSGSVTIIASGEFSDSQGNDFEDSKSVTISIVAPEPSTPSVPEKPAEPVISSNANLKNLVIQPVDFTGFRASKTSGYSVTVENDVTKVTVIPTLADSKASYEITGHTNLKEGTNIVKVLVTAENGTKKTYQVNVIRKVANAEVTPNITDGVADSTGIANTIGLSKLEVKGFDLSSEFAPNIYRYIIQLEDEKSLTLEQVKELIVAEVNFEGGTFEITGEDELNKEENEVIISVKDADGREIAIYTLVFKYPQVEDTANTAGIVSDIIKNKDNEMGNDKFDKEQLIIIFSITIILCIAIKSSITSYRQRKILQENGLIKVKENEEEFIEEDENRLEENDETVEEEKITQNEPNEENKNDYIKDIFENNQMEFKSEDKDFVKKKRGKGKHS